MSTIPALQSDTPIGENNISSVETKPHREVVLSGYETIMRPIPVLAQMYKWHPTGLRVTMDLPIVGNDKSFLFIFRVTPTILSPGFCVGSFKNGPVVYGNALPLRHTSADSISTPAIYCEKSGIRFVHHSSTPLMSLVSLAHARWRGGISYQLRTTSQFTNQANVFVTRLPPCLDTYLAFDGENINTDDGSTSINTVSHVCANVSRITAEADLYQTNTWINADLSAQRHLEFTVPYENPTVTVDTRQHMIQCSQPSTNGVNAKFSHGDGTVFHQWWALGLKAGIDAGSGPKQISFEIYQKAEQDLQFFNFLGYPRVLPSNQEYQFLTDYNNAPGKNAFYIPNSVWKNNVSEFILNEE